MSEGDWDKIHTMRPEDSTRAANSYALSRRVIQLRTQTNNDPVNAARWWVNKKKETKRA